MLAGAGRRAPCREAWPGCGSPVSITSISAYATVGLERALYDALLPALGLTEIVESPGAREYYEPAQPGESRRFFGLNADPGHHGNETRICFAAVSPSDVDRLASIARAAGARAMEGPEIPYSSEKYYAVFFEDRSGKKLEIAYRRPHLAHSAAARDEAGGGAES